MSFRKQTYHPYLIWKSWWRIKSPTMQSMCMHTSCVYPLHVLWDWLYWFIVQIGKDLYTEELLFISSLNTSLLSFSAVYITIIARKELKWYQTSGYWNTKNSFKKYVVVSNCHFTSQEHLRLRNVITSKVPVADKTTPDQRKPAYVWQATHFLWSAAYS